MCACFREIKFNAGEKERERERPPKRPVERKRSTEFYDYYVSHSGLGNVIKSILHSEHFRASVCGARARARAPRGNDEPSISRSEFARGVIMAPLSSCSCLMKISLEAPTWSINYREYILCVTPMALCVRVISRS